MADRYWVGGSANWDGTAGTKWATTSGGTGGASVPTSADDVFFDAASGAVTCFVSAQVACRNLNFTGFTGTFAGNFGFNIHGSLTTVPSMTWTHIASLLFSATSGSWTITTNGLTLSSSIGINAAGTWTLGSALTTTANIEVNSGTFNTNNFNLTSATLRSNNSNVRAINLGSSTIINNGGPSALDFSTSTNLTFNAGTSQINFSQSNANLLGGSQTFYNVAFTNTNAGTRVIAGANTFNNLSVTAPSSAGVAQFSISANQTINGTLSTTGTAGNRRVWFSSNTYGVRRTITVNGSTSLTDADFRDIIVNGTAAPISGTRIGNRGACTGITFSAPKTVFWNLAAGGNWSANAWATSSGGGVSTDNFPLPQDTATFVNTGLNTSATVTLDSAIGYVGTMNMSGRSTAMTINVSVNTICYGSWTNSSTVTVSNTGTTLIFSGEGTKIITSAGRGFAPNVNIDAYGGVIEFADAFSNDIRTLSVSNGTLDTKGYAVTGVNGISFGGTGVRAIYLRNSTLNTGAGSGTVAFGNNTANLTFDAGTSTIPAVSVGTGNPTYTFYNVNGGSFSSPCIFNNFTPTIGANRTNVVSFGTTSITINGTLDLSATTPLNRVLIQGTTAKTTLTVNAITGNDIDFQDIILAGAAAGYAPARGGNIGGNSGITFPAPKTVYRVGSNTDWYTNSWSDTPGGSPNTIYFPLAQDTAVIDNNSTASSITLGGSGLAVLGFLDCSTRTNPLTLSVSNANWYNLGTLSSAITVSGGTFNLVGALGGNFSQNGATISSRLDFYGFYSPITLTSALFTSGQVILQTGTFDAATYNVTCSVFTTDNTNTRALKMGSGLWTLTGTGACFNIGTLAFNQGPLAFDKGTANILLSNNTTTARTFQGGTNNPNGGNSFNKLTIGGDTSTSTTTLVGRNNMFTEIASTKTVAHTISFSDNQYFGKWSITGSAGNVVTLSGTATSNRINGAATSGIDYLAMGSIGFSTSPGEFFAGPNSTGTAGQPVFRTAPPAPRTLYWVGGTGNWSDTARWSLSSGGAGGQAVPTSLDDVIFNSASNATAYTVTMDVEARCKTFTMNPPATGNVTWAGSAQLSAHGNVTLSATGITRTWNGTLNLSGSTAGNTLTTNGVVIAGAVVTNGVGAEWALGSALSNSVNLASQFIVENGTFSTNNFNITTFVFSAGSQNNTRVFNMGSSTVTVNWGQAPISFANGRGLTVNAGTSTLQTTSTGNGTQYTFSGQTLYNITATGVGSSPLQISGPFTCNNLTISPGTIGANSATFNSNVTINGSLISSNSATARIFIRSDVIGTPRTFTINGSSSLTDVDFRDIIVTGTAAPISGTRLGNCGGNSGITFPAPKTVYRSTVVNNAFSADNWALTSGGTPSLSNFPLAQDTIIIDNNSNNRIDAGGYNVGTIDASTRTSSFVLRNGYNFYGSIYLTSFCAIDGAGAGTNFFGRGNNFLNLNGASISQSSTTLDLFNGSLTLQSALTISLSFGLTSGTFDAASYNVSCSGFFSNNSNVRTVNIGLGTFTASGSSTAWDTGVVTNLSILGSGVISLTNGSSKSFSGGGGNYSNITLNQGGTGTLSITGNNRFKNITNTAAGATTIDLGTTIQRVGAFTATGTAGNVLTITGETSSIIYLGSGTVGFGVDYLRVQGRAYSSSGSMTNIWYAGANSTNNGSLGWVFEAGPPPPPPPVANANFFLLFA